MISLFFSCFPIDKLINLFLVYFLLGNFFCSSDKMDIKESELLPNTEKKLQNIEEKLQYIKNIKGDTIELFTPQSNPTHKKIDLFAKNNVTHRLGYPFPSTHTCPEFKYLNGYLWPINQPSIGPSGFVFYDPDENDPSKRSNAETHANIYFKKLPIASIADTREYIEHLLFLEVYTPGFIIENWDNKCFKYRQYDKKLLIKKRIQITKPFVTKYQNYEKHTFFVFKRPTEGGTIYRYEIVVKNKHISGDINIFPLICFRDTWGRQ